MLKISTVFLILATLAVLSSVSSSRVVEDPEDKCKTKHNVSIKEMDDLFNTLRQGYDGVDSKYKCFLHCLMENNDFIRTDGNGKFDFSRLVAIERDNPINQRRIKVADDCDSLHSLEDDVCERTFKVIVCIARNLKND